MNNQFNALLYIAFFIFVIAIGSVVVREGSVFLANLGEHIMRLFKYADLRPSNSRGFSSFIQLIAIAIFTGWAIKRFKKK
jgi:hypothetical protein